MDLLKEKYNELLNLNPNEVSFDKKYSQAIQSLIEHIVMCDSISIKSLLIEEIKINWNSYFPVWLELLLFKIYIQKNPNDREMFDFGVSEYWRHLAYSDINVIIESLTPNAA